MIWILFPVAGCNPVVINKRGGGKWFDSIKVHQIWLHSIMVSTVACHAINRSSILLGAAKFPLVVKWYNNRLITGHYKFDSCREDQV